MTDEPSDEEKATLWNWQIPLDDLCGSCDGKEAPDPECEWCRGTGIDDGTYQPAPITATDGMERLVAELVEELHMEADAIGVGSGAPTARLLRRAAEQLAALVEARQERDVAAMLAKTWSTLAHEQAADLAAAVAALTEIAAMCKVSGGIYHLTRIAAVAAAATTGPQTDA